MKRSETPPRPGIHRAQKKSPPAPPPAVRAFVHDVVNPIAAIRLSTGALLANSALNGSEIDEVHRIEEAAGTLVRLISNLGPYPVKLDRASADPPAAPPATDLYVICCEVAAARRLADGKVVQCRAFGDPRGQWDRHQVRQLVSALLDHAIGHLEKKTPVTLAVTGMARHVRVDVHGLGWLTPLQRETALDFVSKLGPSPRGTMVGATTAPNGGIIFRLRLPRSEVAAPGDGQKITPRSKRP